MLWSPGAVYGFVRAAGFRTDQWGRAVALALATSSGDDLYHDVAWPGPSHDARGLFGIDVARYGQFAGEDLFDPRRNCRVAYALTTAADGDFGWSSTPMPSTTSEAFVAAVAAIKRGVTGQAIPTSSTDPGSDPTVLEQMRALAGLSDYVRTQLRRGV